MPELNAGYCSSRRRWLFAILGAAQLAMPAAFALDAEQVFDRVAPSIVLILAKDKRTVNQGSGVVVARERVITNCHVVKQRGQLTVKWKERELSASIEREDSKRDLCRLVVPGLDAPVATHAKLASVRIGQRVYAVGNPEGLELTLTEGLVSAIRNVGKHQLIQTSAPYTHGSSGGGLFDSEGELVAITSAGVKEGLGLNFAIPAEYIFEGEPPAATAKIGTPVDLPRADAAEATPRFAPTYPRHLTGTDLVDHFKRFSQIVINAQDAPRQLTFLGGGKVTSYCPGCPSNKQTRPTAQGNVSLKPHEGQVCFQWYFTDDPESGCFRLIETEPETFALRKLRGEATVMYYSLLPSRDRAAKVGSEPAKDTSLTAPARNRTNSRRRAKKDE